MEKSMNLTPGLNLEQWQYYLRSFCDPLFHSCTFRDLDGKLRVRAKLLKLGDKKSKTMHRVSFLCVWSLKGVSYFKTKTFHSTKGYTIVTCECVYTSRVCPIMWDFLYCNPPGKVLVVEYSASLVFVLYKENCVEPFCVNFYESDEKFLKNP